MELMQQSGSPTFSAARTVLLLCAPSALAQDPTPKPATGGEAPATGSEAPAPAEAGEAAEGDRPVRRQRRPRVRPLVIEAGTVHPVSGPAITDGVVVVRGERIVAVGKRGEVELPDNAEVRSFPNGHVYPGLIDAATDAFADPALQNDGGLDGGSRIADALFWFGERDDQLVQAGITTAYVTVRAPATVRGQGAIVRPRRPSAAAAAVGAGLDESAALRALTLTPAEILGIAKDTGSLASGKYADVLVTDAPLLRSDSRVLLVLAKGRPEFEVQ